MGMATLLGWLGLRFIYYGSFSRNCIYSEKSVPMKSGVATGKFKFVGRAVAIAEPYEPYACLSEFKTIKYQIQKIEHEIRRDNGSTIEAEKITYFDLNSKIELEPVRLVAVSKHGITTIDSGGGPTEHLILKDKYGALYQIPTVYLGINKGDELLELHRTDGTIELMSADSKLSDL